MTSSLVAGSLRFVWTIPLILATASVLGFILALLGIGLWRDLSWILLATPLVTGLLFSLRSPFQEQLESYRKNVR